MGSNRKKRVFTGFSLILGVFFVAGMILSGCAAPAAPTTPTTPTAPTTPTTPTEPTEPTTPAPTPTPKWRGADKEHPRAAYLMLQQGPWYNDKWYGFKSVCEKYGIEPVQYSAGGYMNVNKQVAQIEDAVAAGFDAIVIHATSTTALTPSIKKALAEGVYVSTEHSPLEEKIAV